MHSAELTAKAAAVLEKKEDAQYYGKIAAEVKQAARKAYVTAPGTLSVYTQTALCAGNLVPVVRGRGNGGSWKASL